MTAGEFNTSTSPERSLVLHFVTGGFSGATQVAIDLALAELNSQEVRPLLVLRRKSNTDAAKVQALRDRGLQVIVLPGWSRLVTIWALYRLCLKLRPDLPEPATDPQALAAALQRLLTEPEFASSLAVNSRRRALAEHGLALMLDRYRQLYLALLQRQPCSDPQELADGQALIRSVHG